MLGTYAFIARLFFGGGEGLGAKKKDKIYELPVFFPYEKSPRQNQCTNVSKLSYFF